MTPRRRLALCAALLLGAVFGFHEIVDPDVFEQVAVGRAILADPGSIGVSSLHFTQPERRYVEDKWLASVLVASVDRLAGEKGLSVYQLVLPVLVAGAWFWMLSQWGAGCGSALAAVALCLVACAFRLEPRPDTISHALLAILIGVLARGTPHRRRLVAVPILMIVWVNLHGYWPVGVVALAAGLLASVVGPRGPLAGGGETPGRAATILGIGVAACVCHPQGWSAFLWPLRQIEILRREPVLKESIVEFFPSTDLLAGMRLADWIFLVCLPIAIAIIEWRAHRFRDELRVAAGALSGCLVLLAPPPGLVEWPYRVTAALLVAAAFLVPREVRAARLFAPVLLAAFAILALPLVRNLSLLPPVSILLLAPAWTELRQRTDLRQPAGSRFRRVAIAVSVTGILATCALARLGDRLAPGSYRAPGRTGWGIDEERFPVGAAAFCSSSSVPQPMLNTFDIGGFLLYRFGPGSKVFLSGNTSTYPPDFLTTYRRDVMGSRDDPEDLYRRFGVRSVLLEHSARETPYLIQRLSRSPRWALVYLDRAACIFAHRDAATAGWVERHAIELEPTATRLVGELPSRPLLPRWLGSRPSAFPALNLGIFLRAVGQVDLARRQAVQLWTFAPTSEVATFSAAAAEEAGDLAGSVGILEAALRASPASGSVRAWLARALFFRADTSLSQGRLDGARDDLVRSLELAPDERGTELALARVSALRGDVSGARRYLDRALDGGSPEIRKAAEGDAVLRPLLR